MRMNDVLALAAAQGMKRYMEKRAGIALPTAVAMTPLIASQAIERAEKTTEALNRAEEEPFKTAANLYTNPAMQAFGLQNIVAAPGEAIAKGLSDAVHSRLFGGETAEFGERKDPYHMIGTSAMQSFGKEMGTTGAGLLRDMANKAVQSVTNAHNVAARTAILGELKSTDSVLSNADNNTLMDAYHTMTRFAPVLSTDKNAVRSFLRQSVMSGSGPDYMSIKLLADSERAVTGDKDKR